MTPDDDRYAPIEHLDDADEWLALLEQRFGIDPEVFADYVVFRANTHTLGIVTRDHQPPRTPPVASMGLPFMHTNMRFPKLTTGAALTFGHHATHNRVAIDADQLDRYLSRRDIRPTAAQREMMDGTGYVMIEHDGVILGLGLYLPGVDTTDAPRLKSLYPKSLANNDSRSALGDVEDEGAQ